MHRLWLSVAIWKRTGNRLIWWIKRYLNSEQEQACCPLWQVYWVRIVISGQSLLLTNKVSSILYIKVPGSRPQISPTSWTTWTSTCLETPGAAAGTHLRWRLWPGVRMPRVTFPALCTVTTTCCVQMWSITITFWKIYLSPWSTSASQAPPYCGRIRSDSTH